MVALFYERSVQTIFLMTVQTKFFTVETLVIVNQSIINFVIDSWKLFIVVAVSVSVFLWNYSWIPAPAKDSVPLVVSPLSINTRKGM